jgi:hypothetical protein
LSCASWKTSEEENCHLSTWQSEASHCTSDLTDNSEERLRTALPSTLQSGFGPLILPLVWALERSPESWLRGAKTDFYRRGIFKILQRCQKCIDRDGDFVEK